MPAVVVAAEQPFPVEVMVFEEDTWRVLSAGNHIREIRQPLQELEAAAVQQQAHQPGDLVRRGNRWFAILHDFDQACPFQAEAVDVALQTLVRQIAEAGVTALAIQPLGACHGPETPAQAADRIRRQPWPDCLERIWIIDSSD